MNLNKEKMEAGFHPFPVKSFRRTIFRILLLLGNFFARSFAQECFPCVNQPCRKVTGIFTRANLPIGYNLITRVPAKSCNISIVELQESSNYLAIRSSDGGYLINGNWAIVPPGRYMGAGTGFTYSHSDVVGGGESIHAPGPTTIPIDIMLIYQSANPGIQYEYWHPFLETQPLQVTFLQNSRPGTLPSSVGNLRMKEHRRSGYNRRRQHKYLQNVQATFIPTPYSRGHEYERDEIASPAWKVWKFTQCSRSCGGGEQQALYICTTPDGQIVEDINCPAPKPRTQVVRCNTKPCPPKWILGEWSSCSVTCGTGQMTRTWTCIQEVSSTTTQILPPALCPPAPAALTQVTQLCTLAPCTRWKVKPWGKCSIECGTGLKTREVTCQVDNIRVSENMCNEEERPPSQELCHGLACASHTWFFTDWSDECIGGCENGVHTRLVWCSPGANSIGKSCPNHQRPGDTKPCTNSQACAAAWFTGPWTPCSVQCGNGTRTREVVCVVYLKRTFRATLEIECDPLSRPLEVDECNTNPCPPHWYYTDWSECTRSCGRGSQRRSVQCLDGTKHPSLICPLSERPSTTRPCNAHPCQKPKDSNCVDRHRSCFLVQQARLCTNSFYKSMCCASCGH